jgi:hypothetical protein
MAYLTMTEAQTAIYDGDDQQAADAIMKQLRAEALEALNGDGPVGHASNVEIYTADDIVVAVVERR